ncbi:general secretion pathway protein E [Parvularcula bermudensis HTCC2503]|uniref:Type II secretion system protein E n=1 Tax=Parvularcula bermudensis (strain ATCC BAA-594 / HTCC2503 / KCTC 12087) TaxID=314260 RepID=E0TBQ1_PARBH|nr:type II secretion system ATPase GspE [Parvularcula bermudensis]ADM09772.1 general secretion pathway protein E [Parvularcula bermudensis HTCC2503]
MSEATASPSSDPAEPDIRFTYAFAKENGLILLGKEPDGQLAIGARAGEDGKTAASPWSLAEAWRVAGNRARIDLLPADIFERKLSEIYSAEGLTAATFDGADDENDLTELATGLPTAADLLDTEDDAPIIRLINALIAEAVKTRASDIHIEPYETELSIRLRIDGVLREVLSLPPKLTPVLTSRIKVMARLDIAESRVPQDGRISVALAGRLVDVRVSTLPSRFGERIVMRLLDKAQAKLDLDTLGMPPDILNRFKGLIGRPNGIVLVTGPTGSGKTTTLYAGLTLLNNPGRNILTVEDPVEYALDGVGQTQVNAKVGMTFATGLRAILRQDPDIVMVGEIRDVETGQIAVQASLTGHLVLSTVHTNSAVGAITRLKDMGVEPFLLSSTLAGVLAQRLVRRLCEACKTPYTASPADLELLGQPSGADEVTLYQPVGCARCGGVGFEGRIGIYELIVADETFKSMVHDDASEQEIAAHVFTDHPTLAQSGFAHVLAGRTSLQEVLRVVKEGDLAL